MAIALPLASHKDLCLSGLKSDFLPSTSPVKVGTCSGIFRSSKKTKRYPQLSCSAVKIVRNTSLDKHVERQKKIRFVQKLKTLLLSKPKHYIPIQILYKCRSYLALPKPRSIISMIHRYPTIFELFTIPYPPTPLNATKEFPQLCVRLMPAASALATQEYNLKLVISNTLVAKLQKLLMLTSYHRLLLSKLVHIAPDLGLPPNFRSRLCNDHPSKFKIVDTSYGRALELVSWDPQLAKPLPVPETDSRNLIVDRPLKFKHLKLWRGLNLKRPHQQFLFKFNELPAVCPYTVKGEELAKESLEAEKRACAVVREILGMTVEKRTLVDHITHFRKDFHLPNKLRSMLVRHPELFYVSLKGQRDSVFLVEGFNEKGALLEEEEALKLKYQLLKLVNEGKRMRREKRRRNRIGHIGIRETDNSNLNGDHELYSENEEDYDDGFENLFESSDSEFENFSSDDDEISEECEDSEHSLHGDLWIPAAASSLEASNENLETW